MKVKCPRCAKETLFTPENRFRPFCSERCQMIDLGNWAEGKYAVPVANPAAREFEDLEEGFNSAASGDPLMEHGDLGGDLGGAHDADTDADHADPTGKGFANSRHDRLH